MAVNPADTAPQTDRFYTAEEVCERYRISRAQFYRLRARGAAPAGVRLTDGPKGRVVYAESDLRAWENARREQPAASA